MLYKYYKIAVKITIIILIMNSLNHTPSPLKYTLNSTAVKAKENINESPQNFLFHTIDPSKSANTDVKHTEDKSKKIRDLEQKVDIILQHNSNLGLQNGHLKLTIHKQQMQIQQMKDQINILLSTHDHIEGLLETQNNQHQLQVSRLYAQVSALHDHCQFLEQTKNSQMQRFKDEKEKTTLNQVQEIKKTNAKDHEIHELQIKKLKDVIGDKTNQMIELNRVHNREKQMLLEQISMLKCDIKQVFNRKEHEICQLKTRHQHQVSNVHNEFKLLSQSLNGFHQLNIKKLKKELRDKILEIERLNNKIDLSADETNFITKQLKEQRDQLDLEIQLLIEQQNEKSHNERHHILHITDVQKDNAAKSYQNKIQVLQQEIAKLHDLLQIGHANKQQQLISQHQNSVQIKSELRALQNANKVLRDKFTEVNLNYLSEIQMLKIKMANLHSADIESIVKVYEPKIEALCVDYQKKSQQLEQLRATMHSQLQSKFHMRKQYETQLSKLRAEVLSMKVQLAAVQIEMKQNVANLRTTVQNVSLSVINEQETKLKANKFYEQEMRKFRANIEAKDNEIELIQQTSNKKQYYYETEITRLNHKLLNSKNELQEHHQKTNRDMAAKNQQIQVLKDLHDSQRSFLLTQISTAKSHNNEQAAKINLIQQQLDCVVKENTVWIQKFNKAGLQKSLCLGQIEKLRLESQASLEEEKDKLNSQGTSNQITLKAYYERKVQELQADNTELKKINTVLSEQITQLVVKYRQLEDNIKELLECQSKLTVFETKILNLGGDNNLVKNLGELLKRV